MVHSTFAQGHVMAGRDSSPLGIPKSPSFHSGLDLVASASVDSLVAAQTSKAAEGAREAKGGRRNARAVRAMQDVGQLPAMQGDGTRLLGIKGTIKVSGGRFNKATLAGVNVTCGKGAGMGFICTFSGGDVWES